MELFNNKTHIINKKNIFNPPYYCFNNLSHHTNFLHGVFTREGGVSDLNFKSLNVGLSTGDNKESVYLNRKMIADCMGVEEKHAIYLNQVHGKDFLVLKVANDNDIITNADGIITNIKGLLTVMQVADCQAVILYDPVNEVIANIHSGWRGSIINIIGRGVEIMMEEFGVNPKNILAAISPSLGPCCAEFTNYKDEIPEHLWQYRNKYNFDFWKMSLDQLIEKGVLYHNIEVAGVCTSCTTEVFYSYRKENITGRFAVAAGVIFK